MQYKKPELMDKIRDYALAYYRENNCMPSIRSISGNVGMDVCSVQKYLVEMDKRGMIDYDGKIRRIHGTSGSAIQQQVYNAGILGAVSCGIPDNAEESVEEYVPLPTSIFGNGELYILEANGDSMTEAGIDDGDLVVVKKTSEARDGDIVVALVDNSTTTLKRLFIDEEQHRVILHPENRSMKDIVVPSCQIQGVAINVIKRL